MATTAALNDNHTGRQVMAVCGSSQRTNAAVNAVRCCSDALMLLTDLHMVG